MKVERWEEETEEEWATRRAEEIAIAENTETTQYFFQQDSMAEDSIIINYAGEGAWTYKEHPEGPFTVAQILGWKKGLEAIEKHREDFPISQVIEWIQDLDKAIQSSTQRTNEK